MARSKRIRIGSHSLNHHLMGRLDETTLRHDLQRSKHILEDRLGVPVSLFSYPFGVARYGAYSRASEDVVRQMGFRCSCTSEIGRIRTGSGNPYLLPRISLVEEDTGLDARAKAAGAYDWIGLAQSAFQRIFPNPHDGYMKTYFLFHDHWTQYIKADWAASQYPFDGFVVIKKTRPWFGADLLRRAKRIGFCKLLDE